MLALALLPFALFGAVGGVPSTLMDDIGIVDVESSKGVGVHLANDNANSPNLDSFDAVPQPPRWPSSFKVNFKFYVPFVSRYQNGPLEYDMKFWRDSENGLQRIARDESEFWYEHAKEDLRWYVSPANYSQPGCLCENLSAGGGPSFRRLLDDPYYEVLSPALPDLTDGSWVFEAATVVNRTGGEAVAVDVWLRHTEHDDGYGVVTVDWRLSVTADGEPVKLDMWGLNWFTGGHWDHYIAEFYGWDASPRFEAGLFDMPPVCKGVKPRPPDVPPLMGGHHLTARLHQAMSGLLPNRFAGDAEYDGHVAKYGRRHAHRAEYEARRAEYYKNKAFIGAHNARRDASHAVALNQFADWTREEYLALTKSKKRQQKGRPDSLKPRKHVPSWPLHMLPATVDWRGTGVDTPIKDQAMCGSCWAFAAVAPMESAYYRAYGEPQMLSEQYLMDCSWPAGNHGCNGGFQDLAFEFAVRNGGVPSNAAYPYEGVNMACRNDTPLAAAFEGYVEVENYQREHLMEALLTKGTMTVSLNADDPAFAFYKSALDIECVGDGMGAAKIVSEMDGGWTIHTHLGRLTNFSGFAFDGIFYSPECKTGPPEQLDHAVMISGYGRDPATGQRYWILKNIWTTYWGEDGYMRMAMDGNDCGVTALPEYVDLDVKATDKLRDKAKRQQPTSV